MNNSTFFTYLIVMAGVTYLIRVIPFVLVKGEINNKHVKVFLNYVPYAVLSSMTFPAIFYATSSYISAVIGMIAALILAIKNKGLMTVAVVSCIVVYIVEFIMGLM